MSEGKSWSRDIAIGFNKSSIEASFHELSESSFRNRLSFFKKKLWSKYRKLIFFEKICLEKNVSGSHEVKMDTNLLDFVLIGTVLILALIVSRNFGLISSKLAVLGSKSDQAVT